MADITHDRRQPSPRSHSQAGPWLMLSLFSAALGAQPTTPVVVPDAPSCADCTITVRHPAAA